MEARPPSPGRRRRLRPELDRLVRQLADLPDDERREVVSAADETASQGRKSLSWAMWDAAHGVVNLGGNAVDDCDRLYDGT